MLCVFVCMFMCVTIMFSAWPFLFVCVYEFSKTGGICVYVLVCVSVTLCVCIFVFFCTYVYCVFIG